MFLGNSSSSVNTSVIKIKKIVIDAGHGGQDPGAVGKKSKEKDITLKVALKLGGYIKKSFPEIDVVYTRKTDVFVELYNRAKIANDNKANLFISIHCNASKNPEAHGSETWVMGINKSQANLEVAKKENAAILFEEDYSEQYDGFDPYSTEASIIFSLYQNAYLEQSLKLASFIQKQFTTKAGRIDRGVKQAGFLVLYKTYMPAALVEIGFISNPQEEELIMSEAGQDIIASAIYRSFKEYKYLVEGVAGAMNDDEETNNVEISIPKDTGTNKIVTDTLKTQTVAVKENVVCFSVQFLTAPHRRNDITADYKGLKDVKFYLQNNTYKYTCGDFKTLKEAADYQQVVHEKGFKDAFVVAFLNGKRISPSEALKFLHQ